MARGRGRAAFGCRLQCRAFCNCQQVLTDSNTALLHDFTVTIPIRNSLATFERTSAVCWPLQSHAAALMQHPHPCCCVTKYQGGSGLDQRPSQRGSLFVTTALLPPTAALLLPAPAALSAVLQCSAEHSCACTTWWSQSDHHTKHPASSLMASSSWPAARRCRLLQRSSSPSKLLPL